MTTKSSVLKKLTCYRIEALLFCIEAVCMAMELCASRVLSPYFGDSNIVWTSIIGIILLSASAGNAIGGKLADERQSGIGKLLGLLIILAAAAILYIPILSDLILTILSHFIINVKVGAIIGTVLLFFPSSLIFGTIPPLVMKLKLHSLSIAGKTVGRLQAISAIGSIFGTFASGFLLVPNFGSRYILFALAAFTALLTVLLGIKSIMRYTFLLLAISVAVAISVFVYRSGTQAAVLEGSQNIVMEYDTQYSHVEIVNGTENGYPVRYMVIGNGCESATYTDEAMKYELVVPYTKYYDLMFEANIKVSNILMIGGGGYSVPQYLVSHYDNLSIDVVEIDGQITELAKKYFFLDDALEEFNSGESTRLNLIQEDGKVFLNTSASTYDAILNDAFSGVTPVESLTTLESVQQISDMLNPGGVYLTNVIGSRTGAGSGFLLAEVKTISQVFDFVYVVPCTEDGETFSDDSVENYMVVASNSPLVLERTVEVDLSDAIILTDDYCPVDSLIPDESLF